MNRSLQVVSLSGEHISKAFPLIKATWPEVDFESWRRYVEFFNDHAQTENRGALAVRDAAGYICGAVAYQLDRDLRRGPVLALHLFTAADLINSLQFVETVLDAVAKRAVELDCAGLHIRVQHGQAGLARRLRALGLCAESSLYRMEVIPQQGDDDSD